jgi:hypothetical protein
MPRRCGPDRLRFHNIPPGIILRRPNLKTSCGIARKQHHDHFTVQSLLLKNSSNIVWYTGLEMYLTVSMLVEVPQGHSKMDAQHIEVAHILITSRLLKEFVFVQIHLLDEKRHFRCQNTYEHST